MQDVNVDEILEDYKTHDRIVTDLSVLRKLSRPTSLEELKEIEFVKRVRKSLKFAWTGGYGLAAIQIGLPLQAAWFRIRYPTHVWENLIFNPQIIKQEGVFYFPQEGCLSIPGRRMTTKRSASIVVKNGDGNIIEATGLRATVLQHEIDHMYGKLCIDHIVTSEKMPGRNEPCPCGSGKKYKKCCIQ